MFQTCLSVCGLICLGASSRLVPHLPNMTVMGAVALKSGARFGIWGMAIPLFSMLISDTIIGFYNWRLLVSVYASFALVTTFGRYAKKRSSAWVSMIALSSSLVFFLITNMVVWATSTWYAHTLSGLIACYVVALPFLAPMVIGDVLFSLLLFKSPAHLPVLKRTLLTAEV